MSEAGEKKTDGISIRVIHIAMILCTVIIAVLVMIFTVQSTDVFNTFSRETGNYIVRQQAAHDLMEASDYLTEMVQRFTQEGDTAYLDSYFEEAFVSKRREAAILTMAENDAEQELIQRLQEAMNESQTLMYREYYAMRLVIEAMEIRDYPETLRSIELKEEDAFLSSEAKMELAQRMVMGSEYYASKAIIRTKLKTNLEMLDDQMSRARQDTTNQMMRQLRTERYIVIALVFILMVLIVLTEKLIMQPLIRAYQYAKRNEKIPEKGAKEILRLARGYNKLRESARPAADSADTPAADSGREEQKQ